MRFYYNDYEFREDKKYLIFFRGCFGPPSKGHYNLVKSFIHLPNVKIYISQIGDEKRHGVPYLLNRKIWKIYLKTFTEEERERVILKKAYSMRDILDEVKDINTVVVLRGNEEPDQKQKEKERKEIYKDVYLRLRPLRIHLHFLIIDRPEKNILSATKFVESVKNNFPERKLRFFMPDISESDFHYIIRNLKKQKLKV